MSRESLALNRKRLGNDNPNVALSLDTLASTLYSQGKWTEDETMLREALAIMRKRWGDVHPVAISLNNLAGNLASQGNVTGAESMYREALAIDRKVLGSEHPSIAITLFNLAQVLRSEGRLAEAETIAGEAVEMYRKLLPNSHPLVAVAIERLAVMLRDNDKPADAEPLLRELLEIASKSAGDNPEKLEGRINAVAENLFRQGKFAEAEPLYREWVQDRRSRLPAGDGEVAASMASLARLLSDWAWVARGSGPAIHPGPDWCGRAKEAESLLRESLAIQLSGKGARDSPPDEVRSRLGGALVVVVVTDTSLTSDSRRSLLAEAGSLLLDSNKALQQSADTDRFHKRDAFTRIIRLYEAKQEPEQAAIWRRKLMDFDKVVPLYNHAKGLEKQGKPAEAEAEYQEVLSIARKSLGTGHSIVASSLRQLTKLLQDAGKLSELEALLRETLALARNSAIPDPSEIETATLELAESLYRQCRYVEAETLYRAAMESKRARLTADNDSILGCMASLGRALADWAWADRQQSAVTVPAAADGGSELQPIKVRAPRDRAQEAERLLRDCLAARLRGSKATHWRTDETRNRLGGALLAVAVTDPALTSESRAARFIEAEAILLESYEALQQSKEPDRKYKGDALTRLVRLYEAWEKPEKAAEWQQKLDGFDKAGTEKAAGKTDASAKP